MEKILWIQIAAVATLLIIPAHAEDGSQDGLTDHKRENMDTGMDYQPHETEKTIEPRKITELNKVVFRNPVHIDTDAQDSQQIISSADKKIIKKPGFGSKLDLVHKLKDGQGYWYRTTHISLNKNNSTVKKVYPVLVIIPAAKRLQDEDNDSTRKGKPYHGYNEKEYYESSLKGKSYNGNKMYKKKYVSPPEERPYESTYIPYPDKLYDFLPKERPYGFIENSYELIKRPLKGRPTEMYNINTGKYYDQTPKRRPFKSYPSYYYQQDKDVYNLYPVSQLQNQYNFQDAKDLEYNNPKGNHDMSYIPYGGLPREPNPSYSDNSDEADSGYRSTKITVSDNTGTEQNVRSLGNPSQKVQQLTGKAGRIQRRYVDVNDLQGNFINEEKEVDNKIKDIKYPVTPKKSDLATVAVSKFWDKQKLQENNTNSTKTNEEKKVPHSPLWTTISPFLKFLKCIFRG